MNEFNFIVVSVLALVLDDEIIYQRFTLLRPLLLIHNEGKVKERREGVGSRRVNSKIVLSIGIYNRTET